MKVRLKSNHDTIGYSNEFNMHGLGEFIVIYEDGDASSEYIRDYDVYVESQDRWMPLREAEKLGYIKVDEYDHHFWEVNNAVSD